MIKDELYTKLQEIFGDTGREKGVFAAPGRVNIIGEHTDYNDGFVLPMAIEKRMYMAVQMRRDRKVRAHALDYNSDTEFHLDKLEFNQNEMWANYIMGVILELQKQGYTLSGANIVFCGNIPPGAGLSSSAALEVVTALSLSVLNSMSIEPVEMALLCQRAENNFVGVDCGIMDQYISRLGQKGQALLIDCRSQEYEKVPFNLKSHTIVICNSRVRRGLADSEYNKRRQECQQAVERLNGKMKKNIRALRDVDPDEFEEHKDILPDKIGSRARHVIYENKRVREFVEALAENDIIKAGKLMTASHKSLRYDYEVSSDELDLLVETALEQAGVAGARMTGAGFGGCTVNLVDKKQVNKFKQRIVTVYRAETGMEPGFYESFAAEGAKEL